MAQTQDTAAVEATDRDSIYIGRQPIFDRDLNVFGYELLFRSGKENRADVLDGDQATSRVILNSFLEIGLDKLVGNTYAFFNLTRNFLLNHSEFPFRSSKIGLEILEDVTVDETLMEAVRGLSAQGFLIALDDFMFTSENAPLAAIANLIKVDIQSMDRNELAQHVTQLRRFPAKLLAEKVEDQEQYEHCRELGFDYFQGYFLCKPKMFEERRLPDNKLNVLRLLTELENPDVGPKELEAIIKHDVSLNYKLLRCVNSAYYGLPISVKSVSHAVVYMGLDTVRNWVRLLVLAGLEDRPDELIQIALTRARMAENLTAHFSEDTKESAFTVGLFSVLDALMEVPMKDIVPRLPLAEEIRDALLESTGPYGRMLAIIRAYEGGDWDALEEQEMWTTEMLSEAYLNALEWATAHIGMTTGTATA